jgi:selenocysteine lyase/cysteine desulfurase
MQGESAMSPDDLRKQLPVTERWAFMDHAAVAPITEPARRAMCEYAEDIARNGDVYESQWTRRVEEVRQLAGRLINADPLDICFIKNTSEGIDFVAEGLPWQSGDNVIIAEEEYPANIYPWMNLASRGVELRFLESRERRLWIDDLRSLMDGRTRLVSLSFVEFASGFRNDLTAISSLCREMRFKGWAASRSTWEIRPSIFFPRMGTSGCWGRRGLGSFICGATW